MLRFVDSFSHYTQAFMPAKWDVVNVGSANCTMAQAVSAVGRFGAGGVTFATDEVTTVPNGVDQYTQKNFAGQSTVIVGMALKQTGTQILGRAGLGGRWLSFMDGGTLQVGIHITQSGQLVAICNRAAGEGYYCDTASSPFYTQLGISASAISSSAFDFLEVKVVFHPTTGSITVRQNGVTFWSLTNVNTAISGSNNCASVIVGGFRKSQSGGQRYSGLRAIISDFHLLDTVVNGSDANDPVDFIGDRRWEVLLPTADGNYTQYTTQGSASHFANVDEVPPTDDTDYNHSSTVDNKDSFVVQDSAGIVGATAIVCLTMYCKKLAGGSNAIKGLARLGGVDRLGTEFQVPADYAFRQSISGTDPAGNPWTVTNYNASEQGYSKTV